MQSSQAGILVTLWMGRSWEEATGLGGAEETEALLGLWLRSVLGETGEVSSLGG